MEKKDIRIVIYKDRFWNVGNVYIDGFFVASINKFYDVKDGCINIYETVGGSGTGYSKGNLIRRIPIGDNYLSTEYV